MDQLIIDCQVVETIARLIFDIYNINTRRSLKWR